MRKFRPFVFDLLTNRTGIFLATVNLCFFVSRDLGTNLHLNFFETVMLIQNFPAIISAILTGKFLNAVLPQLFGVSNSTVGIIFISFFIAFQWLFIAWVAKVTAKVLRKNFLDQS
jgi:uncharacterized membrane protein